MSDITSVKPTDAKDVAASAGTPTTAPAKKDSTNELPMFDLAEALNFVTGIQEKALEAVPMPKVAEGMGYTNPSSTPFYRRIVAARHFGLIAKSGAELSPRARSYLKPDSDDARPRALQEAVTGVAAYGDEIQRYAGKRLNVQFVANSFGTKYGLTDGCALTCAKAFESSLRTAGLLGLDGTLGTQPTTKPATIPAVAPEADQQQQNGGAGVNGTTRTHLLPLAKNRSVSVTAPLDITKKEIERMKKWIDVVLLIEPEEDEAATATASNGQ